MNGLSTLFAAGPAPWLVLAAVAVLGAALGAAGALRVSRRRRPVRRDADGHGSLPGLHHLLSNDTDAAIEELTRALAVSRGSVETYLALGALFRSKGEFERAIRLHQGLVAREDLDDATRTHATYDLGLDYRRAGLLDRAIATFREVLSREPGHAPAARELQRLYEESGDWQAAHDMLRQRARRDEEPAEPVLAHHLVELGARHEQRGDEAEAERSYREALVIDPASGHAALALGRLRVRQGDAREAVTVYERAMDESPGLAAVLYPRLEEAFRALGDEARYERFLRERVVEDEGEIFARLALAEWLGRQGRSAEAIEELRRALEQRPDFVEARRALGEVLLRAGAPDDVARAYRELLDAVVRPMRSFQCRQCGYETAELQWKCPQCQRWDTIAHKRFRRERRRRLRVA